MAPTLLIWVPCSLFASKLTKDKVFKALKLELYKVRARNRSYVKLDLRPIDWARAAVELLIPARCSSPFRASDSVKLSSSGQIFGSNHAS